MNQSNVKTGLQAALLFIIGLSMTSVALAGDKGVAYVSNENGGVTVVDLESMDAKGVLDVEDKGQRGIGITADGKQLVTANQHEGNISIIDTASGKTIKHITIGKNPEFVRVYGNKAYITFEPGSQSGPPPKPGSEASKIEDSDKIPGHIDIVDLKQGKVIKEITGKPETEGLEISKNGKNLIVANESDNSITVHDIKNGKLLKDIAVGSFGNRPRGIKMAPDGKSYVATLELSNKLLVLDGKLKPVKAIDTGKSPYGVSFDRAGKRLYVAVSRDKALEVFDAKSLEKIKDIPTGDRCWHFSFTPDDSQILLACGKSNEVLVIDTSKLEVTKHLGGLGMPWGIVTHPKSMGSLDRP